MDYNERRLKLQRTVATVRSCRFIDTSIVPREAVNVSYQEVIPCFERKHITGCFLGHLANRAIF